LRINEPKSLHERLDEEKDFLKKLKLSVEEGKLEFWIDRKNPPNLTIEEFKIFLNKLRRSFEPDIVPRNSEAGKYGLTGEDECFQFEAKIGFLGTLKDYYVKGFFFDKDNLMGVEIQSFREKPQQVLKFRTRR